MNDPVAGAIISRQQKMASARVNWDAHWKEIAERVLPETARYFTTQGMSPVNLHQDKGDKQAFTRYDSTATVAMERLAAAKNMMLTPTGQIWHTVTAPPFGFRTNTKVRTYFEDVTQRLFHYRYLPTANFASQIWNVWISCATFGTGVMFIDRLAGGGLRYRSVPLHEVYISENHQGIVDTLYRRFPLTARQAVQRFGADNLPPGITRAAEKEPEQEFEFIHCVEPRDNYDPDRKDFRGMPFASYYVALEGQTLVSEGGFNRFPYFVCRFSTLPGEVYGRCPAMSVLPSIKLLNAMKRDFVTIGHQRAVPTYLAHDDGVIDVANLKPGTFTMGGVSADGRKLVQLLDTPGGEIPVFDKLIEEDRNIVNEAFYVNLFQVLVQSRTMTATEVLERSREKAGLLAPIMGRIQGDMSALIDRELDVLSLDRLLPEAPEEVREMNGEYSVVYDSPLNKALRAESGAGFMRLVEQATLFAQTTANPGIMDFANFDRAMAELADINNVPLAWRNTPEEIEQLRESRNAQQQTQQMIDAAPAAAAVLKTVTGGGAR